jgi:hypothetical protein
LRAIAEHLKRDRFQVCCEPRPIKQSHRVYRAKVVVPPSPERAPEHIACLAEGIAASRRGAKNEVKAVIPGRGDGGTHSYCLQSGYPGADTRQRVGLPFFVAQPIYGKSLAGGLEWRDVRN